jgi:hypothetical protein
MPFGAGTEALRQSAYAHEKRHGRYEQNPFVFHVCLFIICLII